MRCDAVLPLLSDYTDRSLSPFAALRVRRHLRHCAACQTAWADAQTFNQEARALYADKIVLPPDLRTRVLLAAPAPVARPILRRRSLTQITVAGLCVTVCLLCVALLNRIFHVPARPAIAFAQVEAAMQNVQNVHWIETNRSSTNFGDGAPLGPPRTIEKWARLDPFALAILNHSAPTPEEPHIVEGTFRSVIDGQQQIMYSSYDNAYRITKFGRLGKNGGLGQWIKSDIVSEIVSPNEAANYLSAPPKNAPWKSRAVTEKGRSLILFERIQQPFTVGNLKGSLVGPVTYQMWVEPDTHRVVRFERKQYAPNGQDIHYQTVAEQFRYNENLPPSTFVLVPPPGAKAIHEEPRHSKAMTPTTTGKPAFGKPTRSKPRQSQAVTLSASEKRKIQAAIDASDRGWRDGNFAAFASVWDFGYLHSQIPTRDAGPVRRQQWVFRVSHQKNNWAEWRSVIVGAENQNFVFSSESTFAPNTPDILRVDVMVTGKPKRGNEREWSGPATFYLNRTKSGAYTVVEWEWNSLWMKTALPSLMAS